MRAAPRPPAFVNDLETCVGCHACALACANENGLAPGTSWRQVITSNADRRPGLPVFHLSLACNHCLDAPCLKGCPARAISRDARTGAVLIDERLCIGCRYCSWVCPYDAPKFDAAAGVMRKCTLCAHRLGEGLQPACVSLCPVGALKLDGANGSTGAATLAPPGFPDVGVRPMIRFLPMRARAAGAHAVEATGEVPSTGPSGPRSSAPKIALRTEWTLVAFTWIATVLSAAILGWMIGAPRVAPAAFAALAAVAAALSARHLGRPLRACRAGLNVRHSWLSREVIAYAAMAPLGTMALATDVPGGRLAWAATLAAAVTVVCVDQVYVAMARRSRPWLDDHAATSSALFLAGLFAGQPVLWGPATAFRAVAFAARVRAGPPGARWDRTRHPAALAARVVLGLAAPAAFWAWAPPSAWPAAIACGIAGEALDRLSFYDHLDVITPGA